jgi:hypothetical protein
LLPISTTLSKLPDLYKTPALRSYIDAEFGSLDGLYLDVLGDFFRHAFDGSGADNFFDAGSCIDGRLTSAWNWCSTLEKKRYFQVFLLTGASMFFSHASCNDIRCAKPWRLLQASLVSMASGNKFIET